MARHQHRLPICLARTLPPSLPRISFDVVVDRIASLYRAHSTAAGAVRAVSRTIRTSFVEAGGKRKAATPIHTNPPTVDTPARKRRVVSVTPAPSITSVIGRPVLSTPCPPRTVALLAHDNHVFNSSSSGAMLINQWGNVVPPHSQHRPSVLQHMYKRMSPDDIVRLSPGDEIIVVLPAVHSRLPTEGVRMIAHYRCLFSRVINLSLPDTVDRADRTTIVTDIIRDNHSFLRADLSSPPDGGSRYVPLLYLPRVTWRGGSSLSGVPEFE